ncbi:hypothetical protein MSAN_01972800 [Mycena sanguinolenta]|uniref:Secreted protein n=1 Tax=Mycena sanguinolenta TaxID=230812 RepID=A0A8H7CMS9_9AGAR|nr:hypothetical protein MSAN_01972800 [Mycena sanguinolenta]
MLVSILLDVISCIFFGATVLRCAQTQRHIEAPLPKSRLHGLHRLSLCEPVLRRDHRPRRVMARRKRAHPSPAVVHLVDGSLGANTALPQIFVLLIALERPPQCTAPLPHSFIGARYRLASLVAIFTVLGTKNTANITCRFTVPTRVGLPPQG